MIPRDEIEQVIATLAAWEADARRRRGNVRTVNVNELASLRRLLVPGSRDVSPTENIQDYADDVLRRRSRSVPPPYRPTTGSFANPEHDPETCGCENHAPWCPFNPNATQVTPFPLPGEAAETRAVPPQPNEQVVKRLNEIVRLTGLIRKTNESVQLAIAARRQAEYAIRELGEAAETRAVPADPFDSAVTWRCSECGDARTVDDPRWRWNGSLWQHAHSYGHVDARAFGTETRAVPRVPEGLCTACSTEPCAEHAETRAVLPEPPCVLGQYCRRHGFVHGAEAEELRQRIERAIEGTQGRTVTISALRHILDDVDARDSLAYLEVEAEQEAKDEADDGALSPDTDTAPSPSE